MRNYLRLLPSRPADLKPARAPRETASTKFLPALLAGQRALAFDRRLLRTGRLSS